MAGIDQNSPENLDLIQEVTKAIQAQTQALDSLTAALGRQQAVSQGAAAAAKEHTAAEVAKKDAAGAVTDAMREQTGGADALAAALGRQGAATKGLTADQIDQIDTIEGLVKKVGGLSVALGAAGEVMNSMKVVFTGGLDLIKGGFSLVTGAISLMMSPFQGLMDMAATYNNQRSKEMWAANQEVTASFGDLKGASGGFVKSMVKDMGQASAALGKAGSSMWSAIGEQADILKTVSKLAGEFGNSLDSLKSQIMGATSEMFLMSRGMGLSGKSFKNLAINAKASGGSLEESLQDGMVASAHLANQFGIDVKDIGKNMEKMASDMESFGHLSTKELAAVAAYSVKLGVSIESLGKTMAAFDTFESAAGNAGKLAEAFGMNIDVMKMMNAENPAERMDMLRKSFEETGKSVNDLSRHELKLLGDSMGGLPVDELKAGLSMSTDEMGFGDFADAAEEAAQKITPEEAMEKVAKSIEDLNEAIRDMTGGPLSEMIGGFKHGVANSAEFKAILGDIGEWLRIFNDAGVRIGKTFARIFLKDGSKFKKVIEGIFNPKSALAFMGKVEDAFNTLFKGFDDGIQDPAKLAENFLSSIMDAFKDWTGGTGTGGLVDLIKDMLIGAFKIIAGMAPGLIKEAAKHIESFTGMLKDFLADPGGKTQGAIGEGLAGAFSEAMSAIVGAWPVLKDALLELMDVIWDQVKWPMFKIFLAILSFSVLKAIATVMLQAAVLKAAKGLFKWIAGLGDKQKEAAVEENDKQSSATKKVVSGLKDVTDELVKNDVGNIKKAAKILLLLALTFAANMIIFAIAIKGVDMMIGDIPWERLGKAFAMMGVSILSTIALIKVAEMLDKAKGSMKKAGLGLLAGALFFAGGVIAFGAGIWAMDKIIGKISFGSFLKSIAMIAIAVIAAIGFVLVGALFYAAVIQTGAIGLAALGLLAAAAFFAGGVILFGLGLMLMQKTVGTLNFTSVLKSFAMLAIAVVAAGVFIVAGALLATPAGLIAMAAAAVGLIAASKLLEHGLVLFGNALAKGLKPFASIDLKKAGIAFLMIQGALVALVEMVAVGTIFAAMDFFGGVSILKKAIGTASEFAIGSFKQFAVIITELLKIKMGDPKIFAQKMAAMGLLIKAVADLANLGMQAAAMATISSLLGGGEPADMMFEMSMFITAVVGSMKDIVTTFVDIAKSLNPEDLKGVDAVAKIIGSIAQLAGALINPIQEMQKNVSIIGILKGDTASNQMNTMTEGIKGIMEGLNEHIGGLVQNLIDITKQIDNPDVFLKKAQALEAMFNGILSITDAVTKLYFGAKEEGKGWITDDSADTVLNDMFGTIWRVMLPGGMFRQMVHAVIGTLNECVFPEAALIDNFTKGMTSMMKIVNGLATFGTEMADGGENSIAKLGNIMARWKSAKYWSPGEIVKMIVDEAATIAGHIGNMEADLGQIHLRPLVDGVLGYEGDRKFTVSAEAVKLHVKLQVAINAEELATSIAKGNEDLDGFFITTESADKSLLEGDRGMG